MIRYTLKCDKNHSFESWFNSASAYEKLLESDMISCAICGSHKVEKAIMAPKIWPARSKAAKPNPTSSRTPVANASLALSPEEKAFANMRREIEEKSENVGEKFADEARAIHYGDAPERPIIGEATPDAAKSLLEDGIAVAPLPWQNRKSN